jgi:hypothetical protein
MGTDDRILAVDLGPSPRARRGWPRSTAWPPPCRSGGMVRDLLERYIDLLYRP